MSLLLRARSNLGSALLFSAVLLFVRVLSQQDGDIQLVGYGSSRLAGRVEIFLSGQWGTICGDENFDPVSAAHVVCRQLRLGHAIGYHGIPLLRYGVGNGSIWLEGVYCHDDDLHLLRCRHSVVGVNSHCNHHMDVSVMCSTPTQWSIEGMGALSNFHTISNSWATQNIHCLKAGVSTPYEGEVRLVGGDFASEGSLDLYLHRQWAPVCSRSMDSGLSNTICRQLGYTGAQRYFPVDNATDLAFWQVEVPSSPSHSFPCLRSYLPDMSSSQLVDSCQDGRLTWRVQCVLVLEFENATSGSADLCALNNTEPEEGRVRLYGNNPEQGRVEVYMDGLWASLCKSTMFGIEEATVVCKQQGFPTALLYITVSEVPVAIGSGPQYSIQCTGLETHITNCTLTSMASPVHEDDAYIHCSPILWPFGSLQLAGGAGSYGQLLVDTNNQFHWLCDAHFSMTEANVACRQMGYSGAIRIVHNSLLSTPALASPPSSLLPFSLDCTGKEDFLLACERRSVSSEVCREELDAVAVQCGSSDSSDGWEVRLVPSDQGNSSESGEGVRVGRVEVLLEESGEWGTVCSDGFSEISAHVICRQLGFETFEEVFTGNPASDSLPVLLSSVQCTGFEERLNYCPHVLAGQNCTHSSDISINCSGLIPHADGLLRLVNSTTSPSPNPRDGRLEVSYHGLWMSVCGRLITHDVADVACRELGFGAAEYYCQDACFGSGSDFIHFAEYSCEGNEGSLLQCGVSIHNSASCSHDNDVGLSCLPLPPQASSTLSLPSSPTPQPSLPNTIPAHTTSTASQPAPTIIIPPDSSTPNEKNSFTSDSLFYVVISVVCLLVLALIVAFTVCCVCKKKHSSWELTPNRRYVSRDAVDGHNGPITPGVSISNGGGAAEAAGPSEFDFDAMAEAVEMKACSKEAEAMELPADRVSISSAGPPPQYDELEFLSRTIPDKAVKDLS